MISNERPSPYGRSRPDPRYNQPPAPRPFVQEDTIKTAEVQIERKLFVVMLKENPRGRFLRICEEVAGKRNTIIIPAPGLKEFVKILNEMVKTSDDTPAKG
jgi:hypothetical protein